MVQVEVESRVKSPIINNQRHLRHIQPPSPNISRNQNPTLPRPKLSHNLTPLPLRQITVHATNCKVIITHFFSQPFHLSFGVAEDDRLGDGEGVVEVT